jgi:hypothetical protein
MVRMVRIRVRVRVREFCAIVIEFQYKQSNRSVLLIMLL